MNAPARSAPMPTGLTAKLLVSARDLAIWHEDQGRSGTATTIYNLVWEIELLREAAKGSLLIVNQACADKTLAQLKATALLTVAEKISPIIDNEIEDRQRGGNAEDWAVLQALSDQLHAAIKLAKG